MKIEKKQKDEHENCDSNTKKTHTSLEDYTIMEGKEIDGLKQVKVPGKGNCLFEAIVLANHNDYNSDEEYDKNGHKSLRKKLAKKLHEKDRKSVV